MVVKAKHCDVWVWKRKAKISGHETEIRRTGKLNGIPAKIGYVWKSIQEAGWRGRENKRVTRIYKAFKFRVWN